MNASAYHRSPAFGRHPAGASYYLHRGFGQSGQQVTAAAGTTLLTSAPLVAIANPIAGAAVALAGGITDLLAAAGIGKGCGQTCITATTYANQAEVLMKQNLAQYMALPTPRTPAEQAAALANFDQLWSGLQYSCAGVPGAAGTNCIADRQAGACHFKDAQGNCWNWFTGYRDPIQNDPNVSAAGTAAAGTTNLVSSAGSIAQALTDGAGNLAQTLTGGSSGSAGNTGYLLIGLLIIGGALAMELL